MYKQSKSLVAILVVQVAFGLVLAQPKPGRLRSQKQQQAVAPYPSADELKPEVPFEEGINQPDQTYGPPDLTYGPPPADEVIQLPSAADPQDFTPDPDAEEIQPSDQAPALLIQRPRKGQQLRFRQKPEFQSLVLLAQNPRPEIRLVNPDFQEYCCEKHGRIV